MAIFATLTLPSLAYPIRFGELVLVDGQATEPDAFDIFDTERAVVLGRTLPGGALGELSWSASGSDLVIDSESATETSRVSYIIIAHR